jgi:NAD(P)H-dependent nitrite reductase small subunit
VGVGKPKGESRGLEFLQKARPRAIENLLSFFAESARNLDPKTRFLISVVTKVISGSERGIQQYVRRALESGAEPDEVIDAVLCAYPCAGLTKVVDAIDIVLDMGIEGIEMPPGGGPGERSSDEAPGAEDSDTEEVELIDEAAEEAEARVPEALTWVSAGQIADIPPICGRRVIAGDEDIAVFCVEGEFLAIENRCPHKGGSLSEGVTADGIVTCPLHHWRFNLRSGQCPERPKLNIRTFPVRTEGDQVFVGI